MEGFFTWEILATYAGATIFTTMVTQYVKQIPFLQAIPTQVISYIVAILGLLLGTYFTVGLTVENACLCFANAIVICVAANGSYDNLTEVFRCDREEETEEEEE